MSCLHVIDHAPESLAWQLLRASAQAGDIVLLLDAAVGRVHNVDTGVRLAHLQAHADTRCVTGAGEPWSMQDFVAAAARWPVRCWHL